MLRLKHILGPSIPMNEGRVFRFWRSYKYMAYLLLFAVVAALRHPAESLSSAPLSAQIAFWAIGLFAVLNIHGIVHLVIIRLTLWSGRKNIPELLVMVLTLAVVCVIMHPIGLMLGIRFGSFGEWLVFYLFLLILFEAAAFGFLKWGDRVVFPEIYRIPGPDPEKRSGTEVILRGTDLPIEAIDMLTSVDKGTEVLGMGRSVFLDRRFGVVVSELPVDLGFQIHRSVWISHARARDVVRDGRRMLIELPDGRHLPVARSRQTEFENWLRLMSEPNT